MNIGTQRFIEFVDVRRVSMFLTALIF